MASASLEELIQGVALGDLEAFEVLHERLASRLLGLVVSVVRDRAMAQEVCQEVMLTIWLSASRFDPARGSALGWVMMIAHGAAIDRVRAAQASRTRDTRYFNASHSVPFDATADLACDHTQAAHVRRALTALSAAHQEVLTLAYYERLTHPEIAERLGLPLGTAKTRLRNGMHQLRRQLRHVDMP